MSAAERIHLSEGEYLEREAAAETRHEFINGEMVAMAGGSQRHALIGANIIGGLILALGDGPCYPTTGDQRVHVDETGLYTYPDVTVVCGKSVSHTVDRHSIVNPRVIFEVLSPSTEAYDRGAKFGHYRRIPSLAEYVLVSQHTRLVEHYRRKADGRWELTEYRGEGEVALPALECALSLDFIYRRVEDLPLPDGLDDSKGSPPAPG